MAAHGCKVDHTRDSCITTAISSGTTRLIARTMHAKKKLILLVSKCSLISLFSCDPFVPLKINIEYTPNVRVQDFLQDVKYRIFRFRGLPKVLWSFFEWGDKFAIGKAPKFTVKILH